MMPHEELSVKTYVDSNIGPAADWTAGDWRKLEVLRKRFLSDATDEYWTPRDLELYDVTFAQRIAWKWAAVLEGIDRCGWKPTCQRILDWGCGSGIAGRVVAEWSGIRDIYYFDQSSASTRFAVRRAAEEGFHAHFASRDRAIEPGTLLVVSHVVGELTDREQVELTTLAAAADAVIWVEPGAREISLRLTAARDTVLAHGHSVVAPCTRQNSCPMNTAETDWCHFFADPPSEVFQSAFWREFSTQLGIDLRALPYSFMATTRTGGPTGTPGVERLIGRPKKFKAHCELLCCGADGLNSRVLQKRTAPALFRALTRDGLQGRFLWRPDPAKAGRVLDGERLG